MLHDDLVKRFKIRKGYVLRVNYLTTDWSLELTDVQTGQQYSFDSLEALTLHFKNLLQQVNKNKTETPV
jgi:uncharacterized protein YkuJ